MDEQWHVSAQLEDLLAKWLNDFERNQGAIGFPIYPSIMWSLGGSAWKPSDPENTRIELPAEYSAGFYDRGGMPQGGGFVFIPSAKFELIIFRPRDEDLASGRRLIDFDGENIVIR